MAGRRQNTKTRQVAANATIIFKTDKPYNIFRLRFLSVDGTHTPLSDKFRIEAEGENLFSNRFVPVELFCVPTDQVSAAGTAQKGAYVYQFETPITWDARWDITISADSGNSKTWWIMLEGPQGAGE